MNYDPNMTLCGRKAKQQVKLTFALWEYRYVTEVTVGGNATGMNVIECAVGIVADNCYDEGLGCCQLFLTKPEADTLDATDDDGRGEDWLKSMLVSAEIISITPDGTF